jgi:hypothetical protein
MKTKMIFLVTITAIATLSFTYVASTTHKNSTIKKSEDVKTEVSGGLVSEAN